MFMCGCFGFFFATFIGHDYYMDVSFIWHRKLPWICESYLSIESRVFRAFISINRTDNYTVRRGYFRGTGSIAEFAHIIQFMNIEWQEIFHRRPHVIWITPDSYYYLSPDSITHAHMRCFLFDRCMFVNTLVVFTIAIICFAQPMTPWLEL